MSGSLTTSAAIITMVTTMMGTGVNFMPLAFKYVGWQQGSVIISIMGLFTFLSLFSMAYSAHICKFESPSYSLLGEGISKKFRFLVDLTLIGSQFGSSFIFFKYLSSLIFIALQEDGLVSSHNDNLLAITLALAVPFVLLSMKKDLSSLKFTSMLSVISVSYLALLTICCGFLFGGTLAVEPMVAKRYDYTPSLSYFLLALACHANIVKVYNELRTKSIRNIILVSACSALAGTIIYGSVGLCGYRVVGDTLDSDILRDVFLKTNSTLNVKMREVGDKYNIFSRMACYGCMMVLFGGFPVQLQPVTDIILTYLSSENRKSTNIRRLTGAGITVLCLILVLIPGVDPKSALQLIGCLCNGPTSLVFPFIFYAVYVKKRNSLVFLAGACAFLSTILLTYMTYTTISNLGKG